MYVISKQDYYIKEEVQFLIFLKFYKDLIKSNSELVSKLFSTVVNFERIDLCIRFFWQIENFL